MKGSSPLDRARDAFHKAVNRAQVQARQAATVGWRKSTTNVIIDVPGRRNFIYITKSADQTVTVALNRANVPRQPFLPVLVTLENDTLVIVARDNSNAAALANVPDGDYGVPGHPLNAHSDVTLTSLADGEMFVWDATAGAWVNVGIGAEVGAAINAAAADTPLDADKFGFWDAVDSLLKSITWAGFRGLFITFTNKIAVAATATTGAALHVVRDLAAASTDSPVVDIVQDNVGDDQAALRVQQDGTGKLISAFDGASEAFAIADGGGMTLPLIAAKTTPVDADGVLLRDSAASSVVKETTWANLKATLRGFSGAKVINGSNISIANNTFTALTFDSEEYDTDSYHSPSVNTGRLTVPVAGKYLIIAQVAFAQNATGVRGVQIRLNGTTIIASNFVQPFTGASADLVAVTEYNMAASGYVEVLVYQDSGAALNVVYAAQYAPVFSISLRTSP